MCTTRMGAQGGLERVLDSRELEVQVAVNCHVVIN